MDLSQWIGSNQTDAKETISRAMWHLRGLIQSKPNPNTEQTKSQYRADQTPNTIQSKPNPRSRRSQLARHRCSLLVFIVVIIITHRRSLGAWCSLPHRRQQSYFDAQCSVLMLPPPRCSSLFFSLTVSFSQSFTFSLLSKSEMKTTKRKMPLRVSLFIL